MRVNKVVVVLYLVAGVIVATQKDYFANVETLKRFISAVLAVILWPLLLLGVDLHIN